MFGTISETVFNQKNADSGLHKSILPRILQISVATLAVVQQSRYSSLFLSERKQNLISLLLQESRSSDSFEQEGLRRIFAIAVLKKLIMIGFKNLKTLFAVVHADYVRVMGNAFFD